MRSNILWSFLWLRVKGNILSADVRQLETAGRHLLSKCTNFVFLLPNYTNIGASRDVPDTLRRTSMLMRPYDLFCDSESKEISWVNQNILLRAWWSLIKIWWAILYTFKTEGFWVIRNIMRHFIYFWKSFLSQPKYNEPS